MTATSLRMFGSMDGAPAVGERRDDTAFEQSLRDLTRGAADDLETQSPPLDDDIAAAMATGRERPQARTPDASAPSVASLPVSAWDGTTPAHESPGYWASPVGATRRLLTSVAVVLGLFGAALALEHLYAGRPGDGSRRHAFEVSVSQAQAAVARGDVAAAERALALFDAPQDTDPRVQAVRREVDTRRQAHAARLDALQDAGRRASAALGFAEPARAVPDPAPARPPETVQIVGAMGVAVAAAQPGPCNEALVALALCRPEAVSGLQASR
ncbi:hypothetical protein [Variovorax sp. ZT4R33]|uniref:hypothetical protein n=1 Tax=Variovorax sp. ZT4R33 TaxID=3443743 RepID=UPI003F466CA3